jgi:hypothetical protein
MPSPPAFYFQLESCCTGELLYFQPPTTPGAPILANGYTFPHQFLCNPYLIPPEGLVPGECYTVTQIIGNSSGYPPLGSFSLSYLGDAFTDCSVLNLECNACPPCYLVMTCDGSLAPFTTSQDLSAYVGQSVVLVGSDFPETCVQVLNAPQNIQCDLFTSPLAYVEDCVCECYCYNVIANADDCVYVDCDGNFQTTGPLTGTMIDIPCASTTPWIVGNVPPFKFEITNIGPCVNGNCPDPCYNLIDCDGIQDPITTNKVSLGQYAILGQIVKIEGYPDTCWIVTDDGDCECAIDVTVLQFYEDCPTCKNPSKYKLTNCDDSDTIVYTSSDLSAFVGQVILRGECPGCWLVTTIEDIPSDTIVTVSEAYLNCTECTREYYLLTDCTGYKDPIITYTDLSQYLGSVIKIKYCPETCWTVTATNDPTDAGIVIPEVEYEDCPECLLTFPCICTTVRNDSTTSKDYRYYDCNLDIQFFTLAPGEKSERFCIRVWAIYFPETDYIETYGDCSETTPDIWECPAIIYPRRSVQPGYNTPACTIAKYEKISCKSAEVYYKQVLYLRYGISDCCPDENDKWLIKKELIDMDALRDPNYECTASTCGCPPQSCSCNATITTCNSH